MPRPPKTEQPPPSSPIPSGTLDTAALIAAGADHLLGCDKDTARFLRLVVARSQRDLEASEGRCEELERRCRKLADELTAAELHEAALDAECKRLQASAGS